MERETKNDGRQYLNKSSIIQEGSVESSHESVPFLSDQNLLPRLQPWGLIYNVVTLLWQIYLL